MRHPVTRLKRSIVVKVVRRKFTSLSQKPPPPRAYPWQVNLCEGRSPGRHHRDCRRTLLGLWSLFAYRLDVIMGWLTTVLFGKGKVGGQLPDVFLCPGGAQVPFVPVVPHYMTLVKALNSWLRRVHF